jgi:hypothetical protein
MPERPAGTQKKPEAHSFSPQQHLLLTRLFFPIIQLMVGRSLKDRTSPAICLAA